MHALYYIEPNGEGFRAMIDALQAFSGFCAEVAVRTSIKTGHCPPAFVMLDRSGELHYGCMQLYDPEPQRLRMWMIASKCDFGFVLGSVFTQRFASVEDMTLRARDLSRTGLAHLYLRCEIAPQVRPTRRVSERMVAPSGDPGDAINELSRPDWVDLWMPGYYGPPDLPPIYKSAEPTNVNTLLLRPSLSVLSDTGSGLESVFLETVDEVLRKELGIQ